MTYLVIILIIAVVLFLLLSDSFRRNKKKRLQSVRDNYGKIKNEYFNFGKIAAYAELDKEECFQKLSPQTIIDIDIHDVFAFIDRTSSKIGQQYLYDKFCSPTNDIATLQKFGELANYFQQENEKREQTQLLLQNLSDNDAYTITGLLKQQLSETPIWFPLLYINLAILIVLLLLSVKFPVLLLWAFIPAGVNIFVSIWNKALSVSFGRPLLQLNMMIKTAERLQHAELPVDDSNVTNSLQALNAFRKKMRYVVFERENTIDELTKMFLFIFEIIRNMLAVEVLVFHSLMKDVALQYNAIHTLFKYVGETDAAISVAALRHGINYYCIPVFTKEKKELSAKNIYHPLIKDCTRNDFHLSGKSILITGSNMSGKTTFLRTMALNALTAQTIYTCFADELVLPFVKIFSSIRVNDDVLQGKSYYLEEVNIIKSLVDAANEEAQCLFILDEVFKGTNTAERVALGKAVLHYLNKKNNLVFVATHDLELSDMLSDEYELYHFSETIMNNEMYFDHHIKRGQLTDTNAIRLIEIAGFPASIIREAEDIKQQSQDK